MHLVKKIVSFLGMLAIASGVNIGAMNDNDTPTIVLAQSNGKLQTLVHKDKPNNPLTADQIDTIVRTSQQCYQVKISENDKQLVSFWWYKNDPYWAREDCKLANADNFVWKDIGDVSNKFGHDYLGEKAFIYTINYIDQTSTIGQSIAELNNRSFYFLNGLTQPENSYFCINSDVIKTETFTNKPAENKIEIEKIVENEKLNMEPETSTSENKIENEKLNTGSETSTVENNVKATNTNIPTENKIEKLNTNSEPNPTEQKVETENLSKKTETNTPENKVTKTITNIPPDDIVKNKKLDTPEQNGQKFWTPAFVLRIIGGFTGSFIGQSFYEQAKESGFCKRHPWATLFGNFLPFALSCTCAVDKMGDKRNNIDKQIEYQQGHIALSCVAGSILGHLYGKPLTTWASKRINNLRF